MENKSFDFYHQALISEFTAIREASLSRDQVKRTLENFIIVILSAVIVAYPTIVQLEVFLVFPFTSIIITTLTFSRLHQSELNAQLVDYEKILQQNLILFIQSSIKNHEQLLPNLNLIWNWQNFLEEKRQKNYKLNTLSNLTYTGLAIIIAIVSIGLPVVFAFHKQFNSFSIVDHMFLWISLLYSMTLLIFFFKGKFRESH